MPNLNLIDPSAVVSKSAKIGEGCTIGPGVRILGPAKISDYVWLDSNVTIYGDVTIGESTYIGKGCVIGHLRRQELKRLIDGDITIAMIQGHTVLGRRCIVRSGSVLYFDVSIGDHVELGHNVIVREDVRLGDGALVGTNVVLDGETTVGRGVSIQTGCYICRRSKIEDFVFLGPCCVFTNDKYVAQQETTLKGPIVKRGASVGANSTLMPGVIIGEGAVVGAQAVVTKNIPARTIFYSAPNRKARKAPKNWGTLLKDRYNKLVDES